MPRRRDIPFSRGRNDPGQSQRLGRRPAPTLPGRLPGRTPGDHRRAQALAHRACPFSLMATACPGSQPSWLFPLASTKRTRSQAPCISSTRTGAPAGSLSTHGLSFRGLRQRAGAPSSVAVAQVPSTLPCTQPVVSPRATVNQPPACPVIRTRRGLLPALKGMTLTTRPAGVSRTFSASRTGRMPQGRGRGWPKWKHAPGGKTGDRISISSFPGTDAP